MRGHCLSRIAVSGVILCLFFTRALALVEIVSTAPSMAAHGWIAPGASVSLSGKVTPNVSGIPGVKIGYAIINQATGAEVASKAATYAPRPGAPINLSLTIPIPATAPQGKYRAELRVTGASGEVFWREPRAVCFTVTTSPPQSDGFLIPVRGCSELPFSTTNRAANYVYATGSQLTDWKGTPLRISALGWTGTDGGAGWASAGLWTLNYKRVMEAFRSEGFNALRIPWTDAILDARPLTEGFIDADGRANNAELRDPAFKPDKYGNYTYRKTIDIFQYYADYATQIGMKLIFEHHSNRGAGQQQNGLWFSKDIARNFCSDGEYLQGVDGSGPSPGATFGRCDSAESPPSKHVDYDTFRRNWVRLAKKFNNHPAVLGFELHNEPLNMWSPCPAKGPWTHCAPMQINWGVTNDKYDIKWMAQDVGNAIHAVNPDALVILEGPFAGYNGAPTPDWVRPDKPPGTDPNISAADGDLTAVGANPVVLKRPHKLSYSVHLYPGEITGGKSPDYSAAYWMPEFGYLAAQNIAPVLVTEMGACIAKGDTSADARSYLAGVTPFLNGRAGPDRGQTLYGNRQPVGAVWWAGTPNGVDDIVDCSGSDRSPNGLWTGWPSGDYAPFSLNRPETLAVTDQLLFKGAGDISPDNTVVGAGGSVIDDRSNVWSVLDGKVIFNGAVDAGSADATTVAHAGGRVCYRNASGAWFCRSGSSWARSASPLRASANGFVSTSGGPLVIDAAGNFWSIGFGRVMVNGAADNSTEAVVQIAYQGGRIWRMNEKGKWFWKDGLSTGWTAAPETPLSPSDAGKVVTEGGGALIDADKNSWLIAEGKIVVNGVVDRMSDRVIEIVNADGKVWQKNADRLWRWKVRPPDKWAPAGGQASGPKLSASPDRAAVTTGGGSIVMADGSHWTISNGKIIVDGVIDNNAENVVKLALSDGKVWRLNASGLWWSKAKFFDAWSPPGGSPKAPF